MSRYTLVKGNRYRVNLGFCSPMVGNFQGLLSFCELTWLVFEVANGGFVRVKPEDVKAILDAPNEKLEGES